MNNKILKRIIHALPVWYSEVRYREALWWLTKELFNHGKSIKIYASELGGEDHISLNRYETQKQDYCKPCEMTQHKVADFLIWLQIPAITTLPLDPQNTLLCWLWCFRWVQVAFDQQPGVQKTEVWYAWWTHIDHPSYEHIGDYTEAVKITFDPTITSYQALVEFIFSHKDPTFRASKTQYKYAIRYLDEQQQWVIEKKIQEYTLGHTWRPIMLESRKHTHFERAEEYHQNYIAKHKGENTSCTI
jgi:methionine-S-sulfoxide reductase